MRSVAGGIEVILPAIIFLVGCGLAFATGTSWGTFGILIPIVVAVFEKSSPEMMIISMSACMAGAVCGDHCSPISDTTIMASRSTVRSCESCFHTASVCDPGCGSILCNLYCCRLCKNSMDRSSGGNRADADRTFVIKMMNPMPVEKPTE